LLEEIMTVLMDKYYTKDQPSISFTIEYSEVDNKLKIHILYHGENIDIINEYMDEIQKKIVVGKCHDYTHDYSNGINKIKLTI